MTAPPFKAFAGAIEDGNRFELLPLPIPFGIIRNLTICVALQLGLTITFPGQSWSMALGMIGLCLLGVTTTQQCSKRSVHTDRFATNMMSAIMAVWAMIWFAMIYAVQWRNGDQSLICLLAFIRQILLILFLVPRGARYGEHWSAVFDVILGIVLCALLTTTLWPQALVGQILTPEAFQYCVGHGIYAVLAVGSFVVQRRSPPMFLKALAITQWIYSATSMLSLYFSRDWGWTDNSPLWVYGDSAFIAYPLIAYYTEYKRCMSVAPTKSDLLPNQAVPFLIAILVLWLAFGLAHPQELLAALVGTAALFIYSFRVAYVTRQYRQAQEALVTAERMRVGSLIDVVHELRSPLASVVLNASALARAADIPSRLKPSVDNIARRCDTVTRLLNDVLDLERIEAGLMEICLAPVDVPAACQEAIKSVKATADALGVALCEPAAKVSPTVAMADASLLVRVIVNLLDNAIRFTPAGGVVTVSIGCNGASQITVEVQDTGVGLSAEAHTTLFKRFAHAAKPVNGTKGSGLGLSISLSAIEAMGGRLSVMARGDGPGTRATILLRRPSKP